LVSENYARVGESGVRREGAGILIFGVWTLPTV
jgi:hypothetical protein